MKRHYGWQKQKEDPRDHQFFSSIHIAALPKAIDLRTPGKTPPIVNQESIGSCGANSSSSIFLFEEMREGLQDVSLKSRLFIYYYTRYLMRTVKKDSGVDNRSLMKALSKYGACDESLWPYDISKFKIKPPKACINSALDHQVKEYTAINQTLPDLKSCIAQGHPFLLGFYVPESFESEEMAKTGILKMPVRGKIIGGHDVYAIAYDDDKQSFLIGNSWGEDWGQKGYFEMPYEFIIDSKWVTDFWSFRLVS